MIRGNKLNVATSHLPVVTAALSNLILLPFFLRSYSGEDMGYFLFTSTIVNVLIFASVGVPQALVRILAVVAENKAWERKNVILSSVFFPLLGINLIISIFGSACIFIILKTTSKFDVVQLITGLTVLIVFFGKSVGEVFEALVRATGKYYIVNSSLGIANLIQLFVLLSLVYVGVDITFVIAAQVVAPLLNMLYLYYAANKYSPHRLAVAYFNIKELKSIVSDAKWYFVSSLSVIAIFQGSQFVITSFLGVEQFGIYAAMYKFCDLLRVFLSNISSVYFQRVVVKSNCGMHTELLEDFKNLHKLIVTIGMVIFFPGLIIGHAVYIEWIGNNVSGDALTFNLLLLLSFLFGVNQVSSTFIGALNIHGKAVIFGLIQGFVSITLAIIFLSNYSELFTVAVAGIVALLLTNFWYNPYLFIANSYENRHSVT